MRSSLVVAGTFFALVSRADLREVSFMAALPTSVAPKIDGTLDDVCWKVSDWNDRYFVYNHPNPPRELRIRTECAVVYGDAGVYVGVRNWDDAMDKVRRNVIKNRDSSIWKDDSDEIYFDTFANGIGFYKFVVNPNGKYDSSWRMDGANTDANWSYPGVEAAARCLADRWEVELFVPWGAFKLAGKPAPGTVWTFNQCRFRWHEWILSNTAPGGTYLSTDRFGYLYFSEGKAPKADKVLAVVEKRQTGEWGIQIGDKTYLHDDDGTRLCAQSIHEVFAERKKVEDREQAVAATNLVKVMTTAEPIEPLKLRFADRYDFDEPKEYDGYNGHFRHNPHPERYRTERLDWADRLACGTPCVLFMTGFGGTIRDMYEFAVRYGVKPDFFTGDFGQSGIYSDFISHGSATDKRNQLEGLLARNHDAYVLCGYDWSKLPAKYRVEILRRVRDEGKGFVLLFGGFNDVANNDLFGKTKADVRELGRGRIVRVGNFHLWRTPNVDSPDRLLTWRSWYETRSVAIFRAFARAIGLKSPAAVAPPVMKDGSVFLPIEAASTAHCEADWRVRSPDNAIVARGKAVPLVGATSVELPLKECAAGNYQVDVIVRQGGAVCGVETFALTLASPVGKMSIVGGTGPDGRIVPEGKPVQVGVGWERPLSVPVKLTVELSALPHGETYVRKEYPVKAGEKSGPSVVLDKLPTKAGVVTATLSTNGLALARVQKTFFFPTHDFEDYTLIMWDGVGAGGGGLAPLFTPQMVEELGYRNHLGEVGYASALFDSRAVPYCARVCLGDKDGATVWSTLEGRTLGWGQKCLKEIAQRKNGEISPYDPEIIKLVEDDFPHRVTNTAPYGVSVWSLGDENGFTYDLGHGQSDRTSFPAFLKRKYGSIQKFNAVHGTNVDDFAQAPHKRVAESLKSDWPAWWDHVQYVDKMYSDTYQLLRKIIKKYDPKARVGAEGSVAGDLEQTVRDLEFWGPYRDLMADEILRNLASDRVRGIWWGGYSDNPRNGFPEQQWEYLLTGTLNADMWFAADTASTMTCIPGDFTLAPYVARMQPYLKSLRRGVAQTLIHAPFRNDGFAVYYSYASECASKLDDAFVRPKDSFLSLLRFCYRKGYDIRVVTPGTLDRLEAAKVLFLPGCSSLSDGEVAALENFRNHGGKIYFDSTPGVLDGFFVRRGMAPKLGVRKDLVCKTAEDEVVAAYDAAVQALLSAEGIEPKESISGLVPGETIFRVRELSGERLVGFKTCAKSLPRDVTISLGRPGYVYETDVGFVGKTDRISVRATVPFRLYSVFDREQPLPTFATMRKGSVYRFGVFRADGTEIEHRAVLLVGGRDDPSKIVRPLDEAPGTTYRLRDIATGLEQDIRF